MLDWVKKSLLDQWTAIAASPAIFLMAVIVTTVLVWLALRWAYSSRIDSLNDLLRLRDGQVDDYKQKLSGASPDQAKARMDALEQQIAQLVPRSITPDQANKITAAAAAAGRHRIAVTQDMGCADGKKLVTQLAAAFHAAGWDVGTPLVMGPSFHPPSGLGIVIYPGARQSGQQALVAALQAASLQYEMHNYSGGKIPPDGPEVELLITARIT
jgi:hypothetical protein